MKTSIAVALALIVAYGALIGLSNSGTETAAQGYLRKNRNVIAAYATTETRQVVFSGSSLTAAVHFDGFEACTYNLGLIGESALTGMDVVHNGLWMPKTVFVEINFPEREINATLIHSANGWLARHFPGFVYVRPVSYLVQLGGGALQRLRATPVGVGAGAGPVTGKGAGAAQDAELAIQRVVFDTKLAEPVLKNKLAEFAIKIRALQKNGLKVVLLELPIHPLLENTPRARQVRDAFRQSFPDLRLVSAEVLAKGLTIKTSDGLHLTEEDSRGVLRNFLPELQAACAKHAL